MAEGHMKYNSVQGIEEYLVDLDGLNRLIHDRQAAGYDRHERLDDFVVLGRWFTDSCGNFGRCEFELDYKPTDLASRLPKVVRSADILQLVKGLSISSGVHSDVPPSRLVC